MTESCGLADALESVAAEMEKHPSWRSKATSAAPGAWPARIKTLALAAELMTRPEPRSNCLPTGGRCARRRSRNRAGPGGVLAQIVSEELGVPYEQVDVLVADTDLTLDCAADDGLAPDVCHGQCGALCQPRGAQAALARRRPKCWVLRPMNCIFADGFDQKQRPQRRSCRNGEADAPRRPLAQDELSICRADVRTYHHFAFGLAHRQRWSKWMLKPAKPSLKVIAASDVGRVINPLALQGQVEGSISMGWGWRCRRIS